MISFAYNFLFVHIPKTAGNSVQSVLSAYSEDQIVCLSPNQDGTERFGLRSDKFNLHKHSTLKEYRNELDEEIFNKLFKFTSIRNPWDRVVSFYFSPHRGSVSWDRDKFVQMIEQIPPQTASICLNEESASKHLCFDNLDYIVRYENLNDDFKKVCEKIRIPFVPLPVRNRSDRMPYSAYYDDELVELVRDRFSEVIDFFGYKFEKKA